MKLTSAALLARRMLLERTKTLVIKVGSSTITHPGGRGLNYPRLERLVREVADLRSQGKGVILVTSGAIATGEARLERRRSGEDMADNQALAAVGQGMLIHTYANLFAEFGLNVGQVLLTRSDLEDGERRTNSSLTLGKLLQWGVIPVINENDSVAVEEIRWGENDTLSARVAEVVGADLLLLLTDTSGLFTADPRQAGAEAAFLPLVEEITPEIMAAAGGAGSNLGSGGMETKLEAARIAMAAGAAVVIADGAVPGIIGQVLEGVAGTLFPPKKEQVECGKLPGKL